MQVAIASHHAVAVAVAGSFFSFMPHACVHAALMVNCVVMCIYIAISITACMHAIAISDDYFKF